MSNSTISFNQNEIREIDLYIRQSDETPLTPDSVIAYVRDTSETIIETLTATISSNKATIIVTTTTTANPAQYTILWKITSGSNIYYHKSHVLVLEI